MYNIKGGDNMKIKTFPLQFTEEYLDMLKRVAAERNTTIKQFILTAIEEKLERSE